MAEERSRFVWYPGDVVITKLGPNATPKMKEAFRKQQEEMAKKQRSVEKRPPKS